MKSYMMCVCVTMVYYRNTLEKLYQVLDPFPLSHAVISQVCFLLGKITIPSFGSLPPFPHIIFTVISLFIIANFIKQGSMLRKSNKIIYSKLETR